jgi:hypothetical protein
VRCTSSDRTRIHVDDRSNDMTSGLLVIAAETVFDSINDTSKYLNITSLNITLNARSLQM